MIIIICLPHLSDKIDLYIMPFPITDASNLSCIYSGIQLTKRERQHKLTVDNFQCYEVSMPTVRSSIVKKQTVASKSSKTERQTNKQVVN